jgi:outer membrane immunogenic protein
MKKLLLAGVGVLALGVAMASAADLPRRAHRMPTKAAMYEPPFTWTGAYVGIYGGGGFGRSNFSAPLASGGFDLSGAVAGGTLGYNYQMGQAVLGIEGDGGWSNIRGSSTCAGLSCETRNDWLATVRGRLGYAAGRFMPYVTGGAAFGNIKTSVATLGSTDTTRTGWTAGGGVEMHIAGPWSAKLEYLYVDLGRGDSLTGSNTKFDTNIVRAGLNYKFW